MRSDRVLRFVLLILLGILVGSCSSDRMWRISPLDGDASRDRVNLWPLAYHDDGATSVLWPLFDVDEKGFALRPLVARDGTRWSVLWPWASWDTATDTGWAFPYYDAGANAGLFPLANFGELSWVAPFWWWKGAGGEVESGGLFPIVRFGATGWVGPVWWTRDCEGVDGGLFPIATLGRFSYVGPFWWGEDFESHGLFPLYGSGAGETGLSHVGPFWWKGHTDGGFDAGLFPLVWFDDEGSEVAVLPFYCHDLGPDSRTRNYLLGLGHTHESEDRAEDWLLPLYWHRETPEKEDTLLLPFFWKSRRGDAARVHTLLGSRSVDPESESLNVYPLWWSNETEASSWRMLLPLFYYGSEGDDRTLLTPLGGRGWTASGETRYVNFLGPLYHHSESTDGREERTAFLWPLFERHRDGDERTTRALPFLSRKTTPERSDTWYAAGLGHVGSDRTSSSSRLWPLYAESDAEDEPDVLYDLTLYGSRSRGGTTRRHLFPVFCSETSEDSNDVCALAGLAHWASAPGERAWRMWPFVSSSEGRDLPDPLYAMTLVGRSRTDAGESLHVGTPLVYHSSTRRTEHSRSTDRRFLVFFTRSTESRSGLHLPRDTRLGPANLVRRSSCGFLFDAFVARDETYRFWREGLLTDDEQAVLAPFSDRYADVKWVERDPEAAREVLAAHGVETAPDDPGSLRAGLERFAEASTVTVQHEKHRVPLLYGYERTGEKTEWSGPLWLVHSKSEPGHEKHSVLWYAWRSETKGETTTRDIFPFITWDSGSEETEVSFLWRLFHYRREGDERGGHVLFIPWGDV
jgi:hypothetical protein